MKFVANQMTLLITLTALGLLTACAASAPAFDTARYGTAEKDITYCTPNGHPQHMDIYFPESGGPWPVVLYVHGGGWQLGDKAEGEYLRFLNDSGILLASINYRLAEDGRFPVMIEDAKCAVRYLRAHSVELNIDPERIAAAGGSAGGHLAALLGLAGEEAGWDTDEYAEQSSQVKAVLTMSGIFDFTAEMPDFLNAIIVEAFGKPAGTNDPVNAAASPVTYITPDAPPFLIIHGDNDELVPVEQSEILHARLTEAGVTSTLLIVEGGDHGLRGPQAAPDMNEILTTVGQFFETVLKE